MMTRKELMTKNNENFKTLGLEGCKSKNRDLHHNYYAQFVTEDILNTVRRNFEEQIFKSEDPHFNDIPLRLWDSLGKRYFNHFCSVSKKINGQAVCSISDLVCMLKTAASIIKKEGKRVNK